LVRPAPSPDPFAFEPTSPVSGGNSLL
jgi:hypothetical protein